MENHDGSGYARRCVDLLGFESNGVRGYRDVGVGALKTGTCPRVKWG